jgi:carbamoyl-phosphate synthase large subunit
MNILFTCAGRRRYLLKYFKEVIGEDGNIVATDMQLSAPAFTVADVKIQVPRVYAEDYIPKTLEICKEQKIDILISLNVPSQHTYAYALMDAFHLLLHNKDK